MNVQSILGGKGVEVATIAASATLEEAVAILGERRIGALVVSDDGEHIAGILSERDIVRTLASSSATALSSAIETAMSANVVTCKLDDGVDELMSLMTERRIRHLPVVDNDGRMIGIVSIGDVVKARLAALELENNALSQYITGH